MKTRLFIIALCMTTFCSCNKLDVVGMFFSESPGVEERFEQSMKYNAEHPVEGYMAKKDEYSFYLITDPHINDKTNVTSAYVSACLADTSAEMFSVCLGDMEIHKGREAYAAEPLQPLKKNGHRLLTVVGNHDLYYGEWEDFFSLWGSTTYTFVVTTPNGSRDLYIFLDSGNGTFGSKQRKWLGDVLEQASGAGYRHIAVMTHSNIFNEDMSQFTSACFPMEETYDLLDLFARCNVDWMITGHDHYYAHSEFRGVEYYTLNFLAEMEEKGGYYIITVGEGLKLNYIGR